MIFKKKEKQPKKLLQRKWFLLKFVDRKRELIDLQIQNQNDDRFILKNENYKKVV